MIRVTFRKPNPPDAFDKWVLSAQAKAQTLTRGADVDDKIYKAHAKHFLDLFHGKCAYCEAKIVLDQHNGDIDHFRPKGAVTDEHDVPIEVKDAQGKVVPHPGYYWLAYSAENLLPSCIACNRPKRLDGKGRVGKWERFPVSGQHAVDAAGIATESPLLLNPMLESDDPADHLKFDETTGRIIGTTPRGEMCVLVFDLNRDELPGARRDVYDAVLSRGKDAMNAAVDGDTARRDRHLGYLREHRDGEAEYSMAGRVGVARVDKAIKAMT